MVSGKRSIGGTTGGGQMFQDIPETEHTRNLIGQEVCGNDNGSKIIDVAPNCVRHPRLVQVYFVALVMKKRDRNPHYLVCTTAEVHQGQIFSGVVCEKHLRKEIYQAKSWPILGIEKQNLTIAVDGRRHVIKSL